MSVHISRGNTKLGKHTANISLPPVATCPKGAPCANDCCYALKAWKQYPNVRHAWGSNLAEYVMNANGYFASITNWIWHHKPVYFRWHVAGDIPNQEYLDYMKALGRLHKTTSFLCFTKRYELAYAGLPPNLSILASAWPGHGIVHVPNGHGFLPIAWCQDGTETRIPHDAYECPGNCERCRVCWHTTRDVWFHKH